MTAGLLILTMFSLAFAMIAKRASRTMVTAPMVFLALGYLLSTTEFLPHQEMEKILHLVAEITLVILLFLDAAQMNLNALRNDHVWPVRMLVIGLPLTIALGALALPAILLFASLAAETMESEQTNWLIFGAKQLLLGPVVGIAAGLIGGKLMLFANKRKLTAEKFEGVAALALAGTAYLGAIQIGGNGFIAAFVVGLCFGSVVNGACQFVYEFTESEGQMLTWSAFFLLGLVLVPGALQHLDVNSLAIIVLSLFVVRPLAIWLSLIGTDASPVTRLFFGWFGPRGLATALFALLILEQVTDDLAEPVLALAINAVWISALLHGLSAVPAAKWYAAIVGAMGMCPEAEEIENSAKPLVTTSQQS